MHDSVVAVATAGPREWVFASDSTPMVSSTLIHGTLLLSQTILIVHSFVVNQSLHATTATSNSLHTPLVFAALRSAISAPILLVVLNATTRSKQTTTTTTTTNRHRYKCKDYQDAALCGFFGVFLYPLLYAFGLRSTTPTAACVCEALTPIFSLALESLFSTRTHPTGLSPTRALAVLLAVSGSIVMTVHGAFVDSASKDVAAVSVQVAGRTVGNLFVIASAAAYAFFLTVQRRTLQESATSTSVMFLTAYGNLFGSLFLIGSAWLLGALDPTELFSNYEPFFFYGMIWAALITSVLGYTLEGLANSWSSPTLVAVYNAVQPFGAGIVSQGISGGRHAASTIELGAAALVCSGVLLLRSEKNDGGKDTSVVGEKKERHSHVV